MQELHNRPNLSDFTHWIMQYYNMGLDYFIGFFDGAIKTFPVPIQGLINFFLSISYFVIVCAGVLCSVCILGHLADKTDEKNKPQK